MLTVCLLGVVGGAGQLEKVFKAAVGFLEEGSLEARTYGKRIIWQVTMQWDFLSLAGHVSSMLAPATTLPGRHLLSEQCSHNPCHG